MGNRTTIVSDLLDLSALSLEELPDNTDPALIRAVALVLDDVDGPRSTVGGGGGNNS